MIHRATNPTDNQLNTWIGQRTAFYDRLLGVYQDALTRLEPRTQSRWTRGLALAYRAVRVEGEHQGKRIVLSIQARLGERGS